MSLNRFEELFVELFNFYVKTTSIHSLMAFPCPFSDFIPIQLR
jgi:hypothetical protein